MNPRILPAALLLLSAIPAGAAANGFPFSEEELTYTINWPSGLSLGESHMTARQVSTGWAFQLTLDASIPGFAVRDEYRSQASKDLCSSQFSKRSSHGSRKAEETTLIDLSRSSATRATTNGGKSEFSVTDCARDALTYVFWGRRELGQGRVPKAQQVLFGSLYQATLDYAGAATVRVNDKQTETDKLVCQLKGPASNIRFEMYVARDAARTPVLFKVPLAMGMFTMELVR